MRLKFTIGLMTVLLAGNGFSQTLTVDELPDSYCHGAEDNPNYYIEMAGKKVSPGGTSVAKCILRYDENSNETEATIRLNGTDTKIKRAQITFEKGKLSKTQPNLGEKTNYVFYSLDKVTKVLLTVQVDSSSCYPETESCCGNHYSGNLTVERNGERIVVPVFYYRGG